MLYRVNYKNEKWYVGNAECTEEEAKEFIARRFIPVNMERAKIIINAIKKESRKNNGNKKN
jgi:hypothetical protein